MEHSFRRILLHLEGICIFFCALFFYIYYLHGSAILFVVLFLFPDVSFLGYLINRFVGSVSYNIMHTYLFPILFSLFSFIYPSVLIITVIWVAHIGLDRFFGYGLKSSDSFKKTHIQVV